MENEAILQKAINLQAYPLLFATISGAHLYGFPSPDSDYDIRGVHILPIGAVAGLYAPRETVQFDKVIDGVEIDLTTHEVKKFFEGLLNKSGNLIEQVVSPLVLSTSPEHEELKSILPMTLTLHHAHHYFGFSQRKWHEFKENQTVKSLLYVYRVLLTGIHLMKTAEIQSNLVLLNELYKLPYIDDLIARKMSNTEKGLLPSADMDFHTGEFERLTRELEVARDKSTLPEHPKGKGELHSLLLRIRYKTFDDD